MSDKKNTTYVSWIIIIGVLLLAFEVMFFNKGLIFSVLISAILIYYGRKRYHRMKGKLFFWLGCGILFFSIITMFAIRLLILAIAAYIVWKFYQSKKQPQTLEPSNLSPGPMINKEPLIQKQPWLFENILYGHQKTPEHAYDWHDINIQTGIGDTTIDLSYTVLPKGESVISIKGFVGNIKILVPYEIEVSLQHSIVYGSINIFHHEDTRLFNQNFVYQTSNYETSIQKIKIFTSMMVGDVEVQRI